LSAALADVRASHGNLERRLSATEAAFQDADARATRERLGATRKAATREAELEGQIRHEREARADLERALDEADTARNEAQRQLAQVLVREGKLEEAELVALEARETVGTKDHGSRASTRMALGMVRAAQGRDEEAEALLREALEILDGTELLLFSVEPLEMLVQFLRERGRDAEAVPFARRLLELAPAAGLATSFEASAEKIA